VFQEGMEDLQLFRRELNEPGNELVNWAEHSKLMGGFLKFYLNAYFHPQ
jgi:hypothetical protein